MIINVLWIDDELPTTMQYVLEAMRLLGTYEIEAAISINECLDRLKEHARSRTSPDIIILDVIFTISEEERPLANRFMPSERSELGQANRVGLLLMSQITAYLPGVPVLVLTNHSAASAVGNEVLSKLRDNPQVKDILQKPRSAGDLDHLIQEILQK